MRTPPHLVVSLGDPRGIGPEVTLAAARMLRAEHPGVRLTLVGHAGQETDGLPLVEVGNFEGDEASAGAVAGAAIEEGVRRVLAGDGDALVTAPIHKVALRTAGYPEPGHTELLQRLTGAAEVGMLMAAERTRLQAPLRVLLATTHLALREVPGRLTRDLLVRQGLLLDQALREWWGLESPRLALCAFNPHASDGGLFGDEEESIMIPAAQALRGSGVDMTDPLPADTVFSRALGGAFDAVVAPYHDVGMAAFKTVAFGGGVNVTLGLPFPRTSPDHGTAFDIAGRGRADAASMLAALRLAVRLAGSRSPA